MDWCGDPPPQVSSFPTCCLCFILFSNYHRSFPIKIGSLTKYSLWKWYRPPPPPWRPRHCRFRDLWDYLWPEVPRKDFGASLNKKGRIQSRSGLNLRQRGEDRSCDDLGRRRRPSRFKYQINMSMRWIYQELKNTVKGLLIRSFISW